MRPRKDNMSNMNEIEQLEKLISEYENVASHYKEFAIASRGAIRPGEQRTHVYDKSYSNTQEFIAWTTRIKAFLRRSSVSKTDEASKILDYLKTFRGLAEEEKLKTLLAMLKALHENWDLLSQDGAKEWKSEVLITPKFEFKCIGGKGDVKNFTLKNVSSVYVSEICVEAFELLYLDGNKQNIYVSDANIPTSLGPDKSEEFTFKHRYFIHRESLSTEFRFVFTAADEHSNKYRCVATKNVDNPYGKQYMLGDWITHTECLNLPNRTTEEGRTIVYNNVSINGNAQNVQIQQGSDNSTQRQNQKTDFDFDAAQKVIDEILKYQPMFAGEFGDKSQEIIDAIDEAKEAIVAKDSGRLKNAWNWIKNVAANATGGVLAAGIPALLNQVNIL